MKTFRLRALEDGTVHTVSLNDEGHVTFHAHPEAFLEIYRERALVLLGGAADRVPCPCLLLAERIGARSYMPLPGDTVGVRELLGTIRGLRVARRMKRRA
jgi:hypothetical protein